MSNVTKSRKQRLRACEKVLTDHMEEFVRVGLALKQIREEELYKEDGFTRFEDYCRDRWEISSQYARNLMGAAEIRLKLPNVAKSGINRFDPDEPRWTERSVREFKRLDSPTKAAAVAKRIVKDVQRGNGKLSASVVRKAVDKELGVKRGPKPLPPKPKFREVVMRWAGQLNGIAHNLEQVPDDALEFFVQEEPLLAKKLAAAIERVDKSLERIWATLP